jgi:hypothetical protein
MSLEDAVDVVHKMAKYDEFFVNLMMSEELQLQVCVFLLFRIYSTYIYITYTERLHVQAVYTCYILSMPVMRVFCQAHDERGAPTAGMCLRYHSITAATFFTEHVSLLQVFMVKYDEFFLSTSW